MKKSAVFHQMNQPPRWWCSTPEQSARLSLPAIPSRATRRMRSRGVSVADLIDKRSGVKLSCEIAPSWLALNCMGVRICLGQLKSYACDYLERVSRGETLEIVRRGRLVAFMVPPFPLICVGYPRKGWDPLKLFRCCLASFPGPPCAVGQWTAVRGRGGAPAAQRGRTTSRPARIRRILFGQGGGETRCDSSHLAPPVNVPQISTLRVPAPSLIWVHGRKSGDMMIDGVPDVRAANGVRPLNLFGKSTQQRGGDRGLAGAGRGHQLMYGQSTCATHG